MITDETLNKLNDDERNALIKLIGDNKEKGAEKLSAGIKKILNYLGYALSGVGAVAYIIIIAILVAGVDQVDFMLKGKDGWFFGINFVFGLWIRTGFNIQGITYAKDENQEIIKEYHNLKVKDKKEKWFLSFETKMALSVIANTVYQIGMLLVTSVGFIYLAGFEGIKNPIYIWSALSNLMMFSGFGLMALVKTYERYNELKIPVIKERLRKLKAGEVSKVNDKPKEKQTLVVENIDDTANIDVDININTEHQVSS